MDEPNINFRSWIFFWQNNFRILNLPNSKTNKNVNCNIISYQKNFEKCKILYEMQPQNVAKKLSLTYKMEKQHGYNNYVKNYLRNFDRTVGTLVHQWGLHKSWDTEEGKNKL